jgi:hypothetical protein
MFTNAQAVISLGYSSKERGLKKFLKPHELRAFEILLQLDAGDMSFVESTKRPCFWHKFTVTLTKSDYPLNLNDPMDNLRYRLLLADPKVCMWEDRGNYPEARWAIVDEETNTRIISDVNKAKIEVWDYISSLRKNPGKANKNLKDVLVMLGKRPAENADLDWLTKQISDIADIQRQDIKPNIYSLLELKNNINFNHELFIKEAIAHGLIRLLKNKYVLKTGEFIADSLEEAIAWVKDPQNSTLVKSFEVQINKK